MKKQPTTVLGQRAAEAEKATLIGFIINFVLSIGKLLAGFWGSSAAMIADAIHSLSDSLTDVVVIVFIKISSRTPDETHEFGHGKFETLATFIISCALLAVGVGIGWNGVRTCIDIYHGEVLHAPTYLALVAAVISIAVKEGLFRYTKKVGQKINSQAVIANAWHHRSDALSSIATLLGIAGAMFLGGKWVILDPLAGVLVSCFIIKVAFQVGIPSINELLEVSLPKEVEAEIKQIIEQTEGVISAHDIRTRKVGNAYAIEAHVFLVDDISFVKAHDITSDIENCLCQRYGEPTIISIHAEPFHE